VSQRPVLTSAGDRQRAASDPAVSAWVSANAGSGKTHVLVNRVVRLLLAGSAPDRILCLTFTKAAASEMANRLFARLGQWAMMDDEGLARAIADIEGARPATEALARARRLFARALETPGGLKIQTIHAFCEGLLQRFPLEAGIAPGFDIVDVRSTAEMIADVRARLLEDAAADPDGPCGRAMAVVVDALSEQAFDAVMAEIIGRRGPFRAAVPATGLLPAATVRLRACLDLDDGDTPETVRDAAARLDDDRRDRYRAIAQVLGTGAVSDRKLAETIVALLATGAPDRRFDLLRQLFLTQAGAPRKRLMTAKPAAAEPELHDWLAGEQERLVAACDLYHRAITAGVTGALMTLADRILSGYEAAKRRHAALDYDDLIARTVELFERSEAAWVLYKLDGGLDHILVDEAQDTSPGQWQVIQALAEEFFSGEGARGQVRTIFAVGDEKQSIFSFQGARPAEFEAMRSHFEQRVTAAALAFRKVPFTVSFRSTQAVLEAVDQVFADAAAARGLGGDADRIVHEAVRRGHAGLIEIWPVVEPDEKQEERDPWEPLDAVSPTSPRVRLAVTIADRIQGWLRDGTVLEPRGRPIRPGDILILVRRRDAFSDAMVRALKQRDIPVAGADRLVLTDHIAVLDLLALARFVLMPDDDLTLAEVLKSPLCDDSQFDEDELRRLAIERRGALWQSLTTRAARDPFAALAFERLTAWRRLALRASPFEFYSSVLGPDGGRREFLRRLGTEANDPLDEFLALTLAYEQQHTPSLQGFLQWVGKAETEIKRDMDHGRDEVRIMTVHGAKGLEANIVFMPDTCAVPTARHDPSVLFVDPPDPRDTGPPIPVWAARRAHDTEAMAAARARLDDERREEYHRLLYVAMTRARDRLYVCGYQGQRGRGEGCWYDLIAHALGDRAERLAEPGGGTLLRIAGSQDLPPDDSHGAGDAAIPRLDPPTWATRNPQPEPQVARPLAPSRLEAVEAEGTVAVGDDQPVASPLRADGALRYRRGRLVHTLLQILPEIARAERAGRAIRWLEANAPDLAAGDRQALLAEVMAVLDHPDFAPLFAPDSRAEVPLTAALPLTGPDGRPVVIAGQVDRLVVTDHEVLIADYKTNRPPPATVDAIAPLYLRQMAAYRMALAQIFPDRAIRCLLVWTDGPRVMELPAEFLDRAFATG
jgi:ATP-dependent helicase/nuclease subunit A